MGLLDVAVGKVAGCQEFDEKLAELRDSLGGYCKALQCVQDYLRIPGLSLWNDELALVIAVKLKEECQWMQQATTRSPGSLMNKQVRYWSIKLWCRDHCFHV